MFGRRPQIVFGFLDDCGYCHETRPAVHALARELPNVRFVESNVSRGGTFPAPVEGFPALALVAPDGAVVATTVGAKSLGELRTWLRGVVAERRKR